jgi:hypothetical protein
MNKNGQLISPSLKNSVAPKDKFLIIFDECKEKIDPHHNNVKAGVPTLSEAGWGGIARLL